MLLLRKAGVGDIGFIQKLARATWPATYGSILSAAQITYMLELFYTTEVLEDQMQKGQQFIIAELDGAAIAFAGFTVDGDKGKLHKLYVSPDVQQSGAGKTLITEVARICKEAGADKLQLNVNRYNKAKAFYEKQGFRVIKEEDISIGQGYFMNDYVMERGL
ncbi:GNAT family N-acetyltransferase [Filimonas effusa]|uniref:GNAT family N-acetyltransferase n=1 Tax=Filimonas effusa TaxID=2508721 RepID=A0A4V1MAN1_9BACT|nr:GNAT family N-acetyltransferase [Filimonas effusa]RXK86456.1 GNAT family N-acetyltransferase [Filimonas effusa]